MPTEYEYDQEADMIDDIHIHSPGAKDEISALPSGGKELKNSRRSSSSNASSGVASQSRTLKS